tara:strand:+ start:414 stop:1193 length:780 start_codon:yes stop_codon:yes gene_type:complete
MPVETATFISQLSATNPLATDPISEGDDQIQLVKEVLQAQFTSLGAAAVTATAAELNLIDGYTGTTAELNYNDITTLGTSENSKTVTQSAGGAIVLGATSGNQTVDVASHDLVDGGLKLAGTLVTASATEINLLDGKSAIGDALLGTAQTFTAGQRGEITTLTPAATVTIDMADSNNFTLTLDQTTAMANPTNDTAGQSGSIFMIQDGTGSRTATWGTDWEFAGGTAPTLTTTASAVDRVDYIIRSATSIQAVATLNLS